MSTTITHQVDGLRIVGAFGDWPARKQSYQLVRAEGALAGPNIRSAPKAIYAADRDLEDSATMVSVARGLCGFWGVV